MRNAVNVFTVQRWIDVFIALHRSWKGKLQILYSTALEDLHAALLHTDCNTT